MTTRKCRKCDAEKPATGEFFPPDPNCRDGLRHVCLVCKRAQFKDWQRRNKDKVKQYKATYQATHREQVNAYHRSYYAGVRIRSGTHVPKRMELDQYRRWAAEYREKNKDRMRAYDNAPERRQARKAGKLRKRYGLTIDQYFAMVEAQQNKCAICDTASRRLVVDHDHTTKRVRGLLCDHCNFRLVAFEKERSWQVRARRYLKRTSGGWLAP